jgi:hypothetical protein
MTTKEMVELLDALKGDATNRLKSASLTVKLLSLRRGATIDGAGCASRFIREFLTLRSYSGGE